MGDDDDVLHEGTVEIRQMIQHGTAVHLDERLGLAGAEPGPAPGGRNDEQAAHQAKRSARIVMSDCRPSRALVRFTFSGEIGTKWTGSSSSSARRRSRRDSRC